MSLFENYFWYPPAEVKIPLSSIISSLFINSTDFEYELNNYLGTKNCVCANSGRALFSELLGFLYKKEELKRNEVLLPAYTCYSIAASVVRAGLKIRVYDVFPDTFEPDYSSLKNCFSGKTLAVLAQYLFGIATSIDEIQKITENTGAYLIEDAAQALGAEYKNNRLGTIADFGFYSFGRGKALPVGCGGALISKDKNVVNSIILPDGGRGIINLAMTVSAQLLSYRFFYRIMEALPLGLGLTIYDPSFDISLMPELMEKLGKKVIRTLDKLNGHRRKIAGIYKDILNGYGIIKEKEDAFSIFTRFPVIGVQDKIPDNLKQYGVRRMYPKSIIDEPEIRKHILNNDDKMPGARTIAEKLITLPTHSGIKERSAEKISYEVKKFIESI
jgi:perosamine synthetase